MSDKRCKDCKYFVSGENPICYVKLYDVFASCFDLFPDECRDYEHKRRWTPAVITAIAALTAIAIYIILGLTTGVWDWG